MVNLLKETKRVIKNNNKKFKDILWIGGTDFYTDENFEKILDIDYDNGFGGQEIADDLIIVGNGWWLEREEYDGSEGWSLKEYPSKPEVKRSNFVVGIGLWDNLSDLN